MRTVRARGRRGSLRVPGAGAIAGLVAVTPAAGNSGPFGAILLGAIAGIACCWFVMKIKPKLGFDDSLDVFGIHGIGGLIGSVLTAVKIGRAHVGTQVTNAQLVRRLLLEKKK